MVDAVVVVVVVGGGVDCRATTWAPTVEPEPGTDDDGAGVTVLEAGCGPVVVVLVEGGAVVVGLDRWWAEGPGAAARPTEVFG